MSCVKVRWAAANVFFVFSLALFRTAFAYPYLFPQHIADGYPETNHAEEPTEDNWNEDLLDWNPGIDLWEEFFPEFGINVIVEEPLDDSSNSGGDGDWELGSDDLGNLDGNLPSSSLNSGDDTEKRIVCGVQDLSPYLTGLKKITEGSTAKPHSWPWQVLLLINSAVSCGGTIISGKVILTAAHCVFSLEKGAVDKEVMRIVSGLHSLSDLNHHESTDLVISDVEKVVYHPGFSETSSNFDDIAIIVVKESLPYNSKIHPICLPNKGEVPNDDDVCVVSGWGATAYEATEEQQNSPNLHQAEIKVVSDAECRRILENHGLANAIDPPSNICAGGNGRDTCQGDSGGPLQCRRRTPQGTNASWYLAGVTAWGKGCGGTTPGIYTQVEYYLDWINSELD